MNSTVDLQKQHLKEFPLMNVRFLNLSHNNIRSIPSAIQGLSLEVLILNYNLIYKFPNIYLPKLHTLEIAYNQLTSTDFSRLNLRTLDIQYNPFEKYHHLESLTKVALSWFLLIDMSALQIDLQSTVLGDLLREYKVFTFEKFVNTFASYTNIILIKAIQYDERGVIPSIIECHPESLHRLYHPHPLILSAKLNIKIFELLLRHVDPFSKFARYVLLWACHRLEAEVVHVMLECNFFAVWEDKMNIISQQVGTPIKGNSGDTPLHFVLRKQCRSEEDYLNQRLLIEMLLPHQDPNAKNCIQMCPIHEVLQVPSLRTFSSCSETHFDYSKRFGLQKDSLMHQATQMGYIQAVQMLAGKISMFTLNKQNKTPKQKSSPSVTLLKYVRKLETLELMEKLVHQQQHLHVSIRNPADFHIQVSEEDDLYEILQSDMTLQDKLIIVILLNLLQFKQLYGVQFKSMRSIKPIQYINRCTQVFKPDVKQLKGHLFDILAMNKRFLQKPHKQHEVTIKKLQHSASFTLDSIADASGDLYDILTLYSTIGINGNLSNRTSLLDYEDFQQRQFRVACFTVPINKNYVSSRQQSPLPRRYNYENFITYRRNKSNTYDPSCVREDLNKSDSPIPNQSYRKKLII